MQEKQHCHCHWLHNDLKNAENVINHFSNRQLLVLVLYKDMAYSWGGSVAEEDKE